MNKSELIKAIAQQAGLTQQQAHEALDALTKAVTEAMGRGAAVQIPGFGTWTVAERGERKGRNLRTGEAITIPACRNVRFKAGSTLAEAVR